MVTCWRKPGKHTVGSPRERPGRSLVKFCAAFRNPKHVSKKEVCDSFSDMVLARMVEEATLCSAKENKQELKKSGMSQRGPSKDSDNPD